jgi:hypothetical protein
MCNNLQYFILNKAKHQQFHIQSDQQENKSSVLPYLLF